MKSINTLGSYSVKFGMEDNPEKDLVLVVSQPSSFENERVVLTIKDVKAEKNIGQITVLAKELKKAIDNSTNCYKYS